MEAAIPIRDFSGFRKLFLRGPNCPIYSALVEYTPSTWFKVGNRSAQAISVVHAGIVLEIDEVNAITRADIAIGSVSEVVLSQKLSENIYWKKLRERQQRLPPVAGEAPIDDTRTAHRRHYQDRYRTSL